jgi:AmmeMemoRadiSam system protein B/AmmeMemoRadiSam system protein A
MAAMQAGPESVRRPAVAGTFYPGERNSLEQTVRSHLRGAFRPTASPKAMIVPHAGYVYSGPVAATAYAVLEKREPPIERVVLLGPSHRVYVRGLAAPSVTSFRTPLGDVPIDRAALESVLSLPQVHVMDEAHALEHSLEVHLPFLQVVLGSFSLVPFSVGNASAEEVAEVLERLWGGPETLVVISSDLSHYLDYERAKRLDEETTRAIETLQPEALGEESACGRVPIRGLLEVARRRGLVCRTVDLRNSGDTQGRRDRVVGYGSYFFLESEPAARAAAGSGPAAAGTSVGDVASAERALRDRVVLEVARRAVEQGVRMGKPLIVDPAAFPPALREWRAAFVTLEKGGQLRGCIGDLEATRPLVVSVADVAFKAALHDRRFQPVTPDELSELHVHASILTPLQRFPVESEAELLAKLRPGVDGLLLRDGAARATFLPQVWESLSDPRDFVTHLKRKAGWPDDYWSPTLQVFRYEAESVG